MVDIAIVDGAILGSHVVVQLIVVNGNYAQVLMFHGAPLHVLATIATEGFSLSASNCGPNIFVSNTRWGPDVNAGIERIDEDQNCDGACHARSTYCPVALKTC
jgi:hypothetical protein